MENYQNDPTFKKFEKLFSADITEMNQIQLAVLYSKITTAISGFAALARVYHYINGGIRHTSQCTCGLTEIEFSSWQHALDWLVDIESLLGL